MPAWLLLNSMRMESLQYVQLATQELGNVWRKHAAYSQRTYQGQWRWPGLCGGAAAAAVTIRCAGFIDSTMRTLLSSQGRGEYIGLGRR